MELGRLRSFPMKMSVSWINRLLSEPCSPTAIERGLIDAGFPIEAKETVTGPDGLDLQLDVEITSNRGDCLSHMGLAREVAAKLGLTLKPPSGTALNWSKSPTASVLALSNPASTACPRFTAHVIRGVKVGPSPAWLRLALESVGQRSINNVVDVTNFISFEQGNPCHVFDLAKLAGGQLNVRLAKAGEVLTTLDGKKRTLAGDELVVADRDRPQSLAGVIGGADSEVSNSTTDVVFEMATWDPVLVRRASRRHGVRTDASHRFERLVDQRTIHEAAERGVALIQQVAGGEVMSEPLSMGMEADAPMRVRFRHRRANDVLGVELASEHVARYLSSLGIEVEPLGRGGDERVCVIPAWRPDLTREIDVIEELARLGGLEQIRTAEKMSLRVKGLQASELARNAAAESLVGLGFFEAISFSFASREVAEMFMPEGLATVAVDDSRRAHEPALRPSVVPGLLASRKVNKDGGVERVGGVRLFEVSAVFGEAKGQSTERTNVGLLADVVFKGKSASIGEIQSGVRLIRGAVETLVKACRGPRVKIEIEARPPHCAAFRAGACAGVRVDGKPLGYFGVVSEAALAAFGLTTPVVAAELGLDLLIEGYPGRSAIASLPAFPGIERDVSFIVPEAVTYASIEGGVAATGVKWLESCGFVGTYRGPQIGKGRKSVTLRLTFRDSARTLTHEEVDGPAAEVVGKLKTLVGAEVRES